MDYLLDPNVAYLLLMGGVLLGLLALIQPGTGLLEVGAGFCLLLAAYAIYNLDFRWWALLIMVLSVVPLVFAVRNYQRALMLLLASLLLAGGSVFLFPGKDDNLIGVNPVLAGLVSLSLSGVFWLAFTKIMEAYRRHPRPDLGEIIGQIGKARTEVFTEGSVQVAAELWSARSAKPIAVGDAIRVVGREGFVLIVEGLEQ